jgi:hypothetical protein
MKQATLVATALAILLAGWQFVYSKSVVVRVEAQNLDARTSERGPNYVVSLPVPEEVSGKRLDSVLLEFYVDVERAESIEEIDYFPSIEVFPLSAAPQVGRALAFTRSHPTSRPVALGEGQRVMVDITDIVRGWMESPSTNYGLVIGSFSGPSVGDLDVRGDVIGGGTAIQATFFYQNRFGQRVSEAR